MRLYFEFSMSHQVKDSALNEETKRERGEAAF